MNNVRDHSCYLRSWKPQEAIELQRFKLFINNEWVDSSDGGVFQSLNPSNNDTIAELASANEKNVDIAVKIARKTFNSGV